MHTCRYNYRGDTLQKVTYWTHSNLWVLCPQTNYTVMLLLPKSPMATLSSIMWNLFLHSYLSPEVLYANLTPFFVNFVIVFRLTWKVDCHRLTSMIPGDCYRSSLYCSIKTNFTRYHGSAFSPTHSFTDCFTSSYRVRLKILVFLVIRRKTSSSRKSKGFEFGQVYLVENLITAEWVDFGY